VDPKLKTKLFIDMYMVSLKLAAKNPWLKPPKEGSPKWEKLDTARKIVEEVGGEYRDFIRVQFTSMQRIGRFPSPGHMCNKHAIDRYIIHQKMKNKYHKKTYSIDGEDFIVHATSKRYPIKQADLPIQQDPVANFAQDMARSGVTPKDRGKALEDLEYAIAKLQYKDKVPTDSMLRMLNRLKEESNGAL